MALLLTIKGLDPEEIDKRVRDTADKLHISDVLEKFPYQVSGGQKPVSYTHLDVYKRQGIRGFGEVFFREIILDLVVHKAVLGHKQVVVGAMVFKKLFMACLLYTSRCV